MSGNIHRYASVAGFVALPVAAAILASRFSALAAWSRLSAWLRGLAVASAMGLGLLWHVAFPGGRLLMGLVERGLLATEIVLLVVLVSGLVRSATRPATRTVEIG